MTAKIWMVIYPSITLFLFVFGTQLSALPLYLRTLILTLILVPWMTFAGIPALDFLLTRFRDKKKLKYRNIKKHALPATMLWLINLTSSTTRLMLCREIL